MFPKTGMLLFFFFKMWVTEENVSFLVPYNTKVQIITIIQIASSKEIIHETSQSVEKSATHETDCALLKARDGFGAMTALSFKYEIIRKPERFLGFSQP